MSTPTRTPSQCAPCSTRTFELSDIAPWGRLCTTCAGRQARHDERHALDRATALDYTDDGPIDH